MRIQNITPRIYLNNPIKFSSQENQTNTTCFSTIPFNTTFEARVDKGLTRFYEANVDRMPLTVKTFIEKLTDKTSKTPLQAQAEAFAALAGITTIAAIKSEFDEPLFSDLKDPSESKATRGILGVFRENRELLDLCNQSILRSGENFTVWLVKKIFLEAKTIEEINEDFNNEVNDEFKNLYLSKEKGEEPIKSSTLKALGIKMPEFEYQQSLRYTREGYSDLVGDKISQAQRDFYASLPIEERTARARKSVQKFENWWNSMTRSEQLDLIAFQLDEIEMLQKFNSSAIGKTRSTKKTHTEQVENINSSIPTTPKIKTESNLSRDDLFKIWAGNNLRLFEANLTDYDRQIIETKRESRRAEWWNTMSPQERTEYINKLRISAEPLKFAMIDAWNRNPDILIELSHTLKKNHFNRPLDVLYGTEEFNEFLSQTMTHFWESHPDFAERLGESIKESHERIKQAIDTGHFGLIKSEISKSRIKREKEVYNAVKNYREVFPEEIYESYPQYMKDFIDAYSDSEGVNIKLLPVKYVQEYFELVKKELPQEVTESWTKSLKKEKLTDMDYINIKKIRDLETFRIAVTSRALEATMADILYRCTQDPDVYLLSNADCKMAIKQVADGRENITIYSHKLNRTFDIPILQSEFDLKEIDKIYESYIEELPENATDAFVDHYFQLNYQKIRTYGEQAEIIEFLNSYLDEYKSSCRILFDNTDEYTPEIRSKFAEKFLNNLPEDIDRDLFYLKLQHPNDFIKEKRIHRLTNLMLKKYNFLPNEAKNLYSYELGKALRERATQELDNFEQFGCKPKKSPNENTKILMLNRVRFSTMHMIFTLAIEQTLADILYENCGNEEVYALSMEELLSNYESFMLIKKFPVKEPFQLSCQSLGRPVEITLKRRIQPYQISQKFNHYYEEIKDYLKEYFEEKQGLSKQEILYILNPDEDKERIDELTKKRIDATINDVIFGE